MVKSFMNSSLIFASFKGALVNLPSPKSISYWWNLGSFLGMMMVLQMGTGIMLSFTYISEVPYAFGVVNYLLAESDYGLVFRWVHLNGASMIFILVYLHMFRGLFMNSSRLEKVWISGVTMYLLLMATAFFGYVLPWGQMSLWGATVITNLFSTIPVIGPKFVIWLWGGYSVNQATVSCFYSLHYLLPFLLMVMIVMHLLLLHESGSSSKVGDFSVTVKVKFHPYFTFKDMINMLGILLMVYLLLYSPYIFGDSENFILANYMSSPIHIKPEWYFLWIYAILRSIPNKLGGVVALIMAILILYMLPIMSTYYSVSGFTINSIFFSFVVVVLLLTWLGGNPVEEPFIKLGQIFTGLYFWFLLLWSSCSLLN